MINFSKICSNDLQPKKIKSGKKNNLKKQNLLVESKSGTATLSVLTNNPLKVKASMLDTSITGALTQKEHGTKAGELKKKVFNVNERTGEVREVDPNAKPKKKGPDLGFDLE